MSNAIAIAQALHLYQAGDTIGAIAALNRAGFIFVEAVEILANYDDPSLTPVSES